MNIKQEQRLESPPLKHLNWMKQYIFAEICEAPNKTDAGCG